MPVIELLMSKGARHDLRSNRALKGHQEVVDYLIRKGSKFEARGTPAKSCKCCGATDVPLKLCTGCGVVYCGPECQIKDWKEGGENCHKIQCKRLVEIRSILGLTTDHSSIKHGQFSNVLIIDRLPLHLYGREESDDGKFSLLAWGGGESCKNHILAAATTRYLHLFSLKSFFSDLPLQLSSSHLTLPITSQGYCSLGLPRPLSHPLFCIDWTQDGQGIFLADAANNVSMLSVAVSDLGGDHKLDADVKEEWSACSDSPHLLAAAGMGPKHPSATSPHPHSHSHPQTQTTPYEGPSSRSSSPAPLASPSQQHRVIIWWPPKDEGEKAKASTKTPRTSSSSSVGAEVIRHPVRVLSMQWSHKHDSTSSSEEATSTSHPHNLHYDSTQGLALMTLGSDWSIRIWVEVVIYDLFSGSNPTSGTSTPGSTPSPLPFSPPTSMSQFCLTLVIDPPFASSLPPALPSSCPRMRASWAKPLFPHPRAYDIESGSQDGHRSHSDEAARSLSSKVHWIVASADVDIEGGQESLVCLWAIDSLSSVVLSGLPRGALSSSKTSSPKAILWGTCSSCPASALKSQSGPAATKKLSYGPPPVSSSSKPRAPPSLPPIPSHGMIGGPAGPSSSSTTTYCPSLSWLDPVSLFPPLNPPSDIEATFPSPYPENSSHSPSLSTSSPPLGAGGRISAYVLYPDGVPMVIAMDFLQTSSGGGGRSCHSEIRSIQMATMTVKDPSLPPSPGKVNPPGSSPHASHSLTTSIHVSGLSHKCWPSLPSSIRHFEARPRGSGEAASIPHLALSLDTADSIGIWSMRDPLEPLPFLKALPEQAVAASWLPSIHEASPNHPEHGFVAYFAAASADVVKVHTILVPPLGNARNEFIAHIGNKGSKPGIPMVKYLGSSCSIQLQNNVEKICILPRNDGISNRVRMVVITRAASGLKAVEEWHLAEEEGKKDKGRYYLTFIASPAPRTSALSLAAANVSCLCCPCDSIAHGAVACSATSDGSIQIWGGDLQLLSSFPPLAQLKGWKVEQINVHSRASLIAVLKSNEQGTTAVSLFKVDLTVSGHALRSEAEIQDFACDGRGKGTSYDIAWVTGVGACPVLAISSSGASGLVLLYSRRPKLPSDPYEQRWKWALIAKYHCGTSGSSLMLASGPPATLNVISARPPVISSLSNIILSGGRSLSDLSSSGICLPPYHPVTIAALVAKALLPEAYAVLRALLLWLRRRTKELEEEEDSTPFANTDEAARDDDSDHGSLNDPWSQLLQPVLDSSRGLFGTKGLQALVEFIQTRTKKTQAAATDPIALSSSASIKAIVEPTAATSSSQLGSSMFSMPRQKPPEPSPLFAPAVKAAPTADPMASGMIDMSAFGMFSAGDDDEYWDAPPSPPVAPPPSPPPLRGLDTGMLDMSAFGFNMSNDDDLDDKGAIEEKATPRLSDPRQAPPPSSSSQQPLASSSEATLFPFPRIVEDGGALSSNLAQPLTELEVNELLSLLLGPKGSKALRQDISSSSSSSTLASSPPSYLPSYLRDEEDYLEKAHEDRALAIRKELGLVVHGPADVTAEALAATALSLSASGSSSSYQQLDDSSRTFLASFRFHASSCSIGPRKTPSSNNLQNRIQSQPSLALSSSSSILAGLNESKALSSAPLASRLGLMGCDDLPSSSLSSSMRAILWAQCSTSQGALVEALLPHSPVMEDDDLDSSAAPSTMSGPGGGAKSSGAAAGLAASLPSWPRWRRMGLGLWLIDPAALKSQAEALSRAQFQRKRDPFDCSLLYIALGKRSALQALFRQGSNTRLADFLARDFSTEEGKSAAAKNAFALLGQHRYDLAAAFFILADQSKDALGVFLRERKDPQLALFIARLLDVTQPSSKQGSSLSSSSDSSSCFELSQWLVDQELLPVVDREPDQQLASITRAILLFASGRSLDAVISLLAPSQPDALTQDPFLMDFLLKKGLAKLSPPPRGISSSHHPTYRGVPSFVPERILEAALTSASSLESMGLPAFAVDALSVASLLHAQLTLSSTSMDKEKQGDPFNEYCESLLASSWCHIEASEGATSSFSSASHHLDPKIIESVRCGIDKLNERWRGGGPTPDPSTVLSILGRHVRESKDDDRIDLPPAPGAPPSLLPHDSTYPSFSAPNEEISRAHTLSGSYKQQQQQGGFVRISSSGGSSGRISMDSSFSGVKRVWGGGQPHPYSLHLGYSHQSIFADEPLEVLKIEGDQVRAAACSGIVTADGAGRPFAVVTGHNGLLWGGLSPPGNKKNIHGTVEDESSPASSFLGLMSQVLEHVRWTPDPWGSQLAEGPISGMGGAHHERQVTRRRRSELSAEASHTHAATVAAHPNNDFYITGSSADQVFLWKHGEAVSRAHFIPMVEAEAVKHQTLLPGFVVAPHWDSAASIAHSRCGTRFAGVGHGGLVAVWSEEVVGAGGIGYASWSHHCLSKQGHAIVMLGDQGSQLVVCGRGERGGVVSWWDINAGPPGPRSLVAEVKGAKGPIKHQPSALALVHSPATPLLVYGDEAGDLTALDLRMLARPVWILPRAHHGPVQSVAAWACGTQAAPSSSVLVPGVSSSPSRGVPAPSSVSVPLQSLLASGGKDGSLVVVDVASGRVVDAVLQAHWTSSKNPLAGMMKLFSGNAGSSANQHRVGASISSVVCLQDGVLTCGADGAVRLIELNPEVVVDK